MTEAVVLLLLVCVAGAVALWLAASVLLLALWLVRAALWVAGLPFRLLRRTVR